jgi:hypothetical protein
MLEKSHISNIDIYTPEWDNIRLGRFTSSKMSSLMAEKPLSSGAITYIQQKAGEFLTGENMEDEVLEDENTAWGLQYEAEALNVFGKLKGLKYLIIQKVIHAPGTRFSSTPDAIWVVDSSLIKEDCYNVSTVEVKCPRKFPRFLSLYQCSTPAELKKHESKYYWQVIDQMDNCNSATGWFVCYNPLFPAGKNMKIIEFKKLDLWDDFIKIKQRKLLALDEFNKIVSQFSL